MARAMGGGRLAMLVSAFAASIGGVLRQNVVHLQNE
jgi:hypothetical protein